MMMGGGNMTDGSMMMGDTGDNMSLPFNMGVLAMPMMCTTPNQLLGSLTGMMGGGMDGDDGNANTTNDDGVDAATNDVWSRWNGRYD